VTTKTDGVISLEKALDMRWPTEATDPGIDLGNHPRPEPAPMAAIRFDDVAIWLR